MGMEVKRELKMKKICFKSGLLWRQTASQPAAAKVMVSGLRCPSHFSPRSVASQAEPFPSCSALQRALSSLCDGGREPSRQGNSRGGNLHSCSHSILERLRRRRYSNLHTARMCNYALCTKCAARSTQLSNQQSVSSHSDDRGRKSAVFSCLDVGGRVGNLFKVKVCRGFCFFSTSLR